MEATSSIPWEGEANVHVSLVSWVKDPQVAPERFVLDDREVAGITSSLTAGRVVAPPSRLVGNAGRSFQGPIPVGAGFELHENEARSILALTDASYSDVVRPFLKGKDLAGSPVQGPRQWTIDFGDMALEDAMRYPAALEVVRTRVKPERDGNARKARRDNWWRFGEMALGMRRALAPLPRFIAGNEYGKRIYFAWQPSVVCPNNKTVAICSADDAVMGMLLSRPFTAWIVRWGGRLKADLHFTPTTVFETYPFPDLTGDEGEHVATAAAALLARRGELCLSDPEKPIGLTTLYNRMEEGAYRDLAKLHRELDAAVLRAYGWPARLANAETDDELLDLLYGRNQELASDPSGYEAFPLRSAEEAEAQLF